MVLELTHVAWEKEIDEKCAALHLTQAEIGMVRQVLSARIKSTNNNPVISRQEFNDLVDKVMCIRFDNGKSFILDCRKGRLTLNSEDR